MPTIKDLPLMLKNYNIEAHSVNVNTNDNGKAIITITPVCCEHLSEKAISDFKDMGFSDTSDNGLSIEIDRYTFTTIYNQDMPEKEKNIGLAFLFISEKYPTDKFFMTDNSLIIENVFPTEHIQEIKVFLSKFGFLHKDTIFELTFNMKDKDDINSYNFAKAFCTTVKNKISSLLK